jgi:hypothetical protein
LDILDIWTLLFILTIPFFIFHYQFHVQLMSKCPRLSIECRPPNRINCYTAPCIQRENLMQSMFKIIRFRNPLKKHIRESGGVSIGAEGIFRDNMVEECKLKKYLSLRRIGMKNRDSYLIALLLTIWITYPHSSLIPLIFLAIELDEIASFRISRILL